MLEGKRIWSSADAHAHRRTVITVDRAENTVLGTSTELGQVPSFELRTDDEVSDPVRLAVLINHVPPEPRTVEMQLGAAGATCQTVSSALRTKVAAAAEYHREGAIQSSRDNPRGHRRSRVGNWL